MKIFDMNEIDDSDLMKKTKEMEDQIRKSIEEGQRISSQNSYQYLKAQNDLTDTKIKLEAEKQKNIREAADNTTELLNCIKAKIEESNKDSKRNYVISLLTLAAAVISIVVSIIF